MVSCSSGETPLRSDIVLPDPARNSYSAITLSSNLLPPAAMTPSGIERASLNTVGAATGVTTIAPAIAAISSCISWESSVQLVQQLWNSLRRRTTSRDAAGLLRLIFDCAAAYASPTTELAKNGD